MGAARRRVWGRRAEEAWEELSDKASHNHIFDITPTLCRYREGEGDIRGSISLDADRILCTGYRALADSMMDVCGGRVSSRFTHTHPVPCVSPSPREACAEARVKTSAAFGTPALWALFPPRPGRSALEVVRSSPSLQADTKTVGAGVRAHRTPPPPPEEQPRNPPNAGLWTCATPSAGNEGDGRGAGRPLGGTPMWARSRHAV